MTKLISIIHNSIYSIEPKHNHFDSIEKRTFFFIEKARAQFLSALSTEDFSLRKINFFHRVPAVTIQICLDMNVWSKCSYIDN